MRRTWITPFGRGNVTGADAQWCRYPAPSGCRSGKTDGDIKSHRGFAAGYAAGDMTNLVVGDHFNK